MQVTWVDQAGEHRAMTVPAWVAEAAGRVLESDVGLAHVRIGGRRPGGPADEHHRHVFAGWQSDRHTGEPDGGEVEVG